METEADRSQGKSDHLRNRLTPDAKVEISAPR
jgi:hypothetical protein